MSYSRTAGRRKKISMQNGLRRIVVRDLSMAGMPKLLEVWVPETQFQSDPQEIADRSKAAAAGILDLSIDTLDIEVML